MKRTAALPILLLAILLCLPCAAEKAITLTFAGDCTLGSDETLRGLRDSFDNVAEENGYDYFFAHYRELFSGDDWTIVNFEGVLANSRTGETASRAIHFRGREEFVQILQAGSVDVISLSNRHSNDYGGPGLLNTIRVAEEAGIRSIWDSNVTVLEKDGVRIGFAAVNFGIFQRAGSEVRDKLLRMRADGEIQAAVVLINQGVPLVSRHNAEQDYYAEYFINEAKADLVIMNQPQVLQGIRIIDRRPVFYSPGVFVYGGNSRIMRGEKVDSLYNMVIQVKMYFGDDNKFLGQQAILYPGRSSGTDPVNNYQPVRLTGGDAKPAIAAIQADTAFELPAAEEDAYGMSQLVLDYLPADDDAPRYAGNGPEPAPPRPTRTNR